MNSATSHAPSFTRVGLETAIEFCGNRDKKQNTITNIVTYIYEHNHIIICAIKYANLMSDDNIFCSFIYHVIIRRRLF